MRIDIFNLAVEEKEKFLYVKDFLRQQKHRNGVIFTGSKLRAQRLSEELLAAGQKHMFAAQRPRNQGPCGGDRKLSQNRRRFDCHRYFARGIDIPHLQWVLNFDLPSEPYYYLHRNGRVGRLDREGDVYNFITSKDAERIERINKALVTQGRTDLKIDASHRQKISHKRK